MNVEKLKKNMMRKVFTGCRFKKIADNIQKMNNKNYNTMYDIAGLADEEDYELSIWDTELRVELEELHGIATANILTLYTI